MTNPPPIAPVEGHYALLRNGTVIRHLSRCEHNADIYRSLMISDCFWHSDGRCFVEHPLNGNDPWPHANIIAIISPADMQIVASNEIERLRAALQKLHDGLAWDWRGHPVGDLPTLREIARTALEGDAL